MEDFYFAEGFGTMSQETEFVIFLHKDSVTCPDNLSAVLEMGAVPTAQSIK